MFCHSVEEAVGLKGDVRRDRDRSRSHDPDVFGSLYSTLTLINGHERTVARPDVHRLWTDEAIVGELLQHVRCPAGSTANSKGRREQLSRHADGMQNERGVEFDVSVEVAARLDLIQDLHCNPFDFL